jgi:DNA polymerase
MLREMGVPFWSAPALASGVAPRSAVAPESGGPVGVAMTHAPHAPAAPDAARAGLPSASDVGPTAEPRAAAQAPAAHGLAPDAAAGAAAADGRPMPRPVPVAVRSAADAAPPAPMVGPQDPVSAPSPEAVAAMAWPALQEAVRHCQACALCSSRTHTVFGVGHPRAHWMVVGEAPGEQEDLRGEPFVGPAGALLDRMLAALGLGRGPGSGAEAADAAGAQADADPARQAYITNTLKCRPPRNRNPEPLEMQRCEPFLQRQIALVQPRIILAMGRFAVQALLRTDEAIGRLRGRVHRYQGVPLVVTYHPAYLLRNPPDKAKAWDDLCLAAQTLTSSDPER